jgi:AsmA protein
MKKFLKWGAIVVGGLIVVIIVALLVIPMFVNVRQYKPMIEKRVAEATGRPVTFGDDLRLSLFPWAGLTFSDLQMGNPPGFTEKEFLTVKSFDVRVRLLPLLFKDIQVQRFVLNEPHIVLVKNKDGRANWEMPQKAEGAQTPAAPAEKPGAFELPIKALAVGDFAITNGTAQYVDHQQGLHEEAKEINLRLQDISLDRPIRIAFSGRLNGQPVALDGSVGPLGRQIGQGTINLDLSLAALNQVKMKLKGQVENPIGAPQVDLAIDIAEFSPREVFAALGQPFPVATADPKALSRLAFAAKVKADRENLAISDGSVTLDESKLAVMLKAANFAKPDVAFDIGLDQIDLDRYMPPKAESKPTQAKPGAAPASAVKPAAKPASAGKPFGLPVVAVDGRLTAGKVIVNKRTIEDIKFTLAGKNGPIKLALAARLQEGPVGVDGTIGPFGPQPGQGSVPLDLSVNAINELKLRASGSVTNPGTQPGVDLTVKADEFSPRKLLAAFGQPFPVATSDPKAIDRVALAVKLKGDANRLSVTDGVMTLDDSKLNFSLRAAEFSKPDIAFDMAVDQINLDRYLPPKTEKTAAAGKPSGSGESGSKQAASQPASGKAGADYGPLRRLVLDGQLKVGKLIVENMKLQEVLLKISGKNGVINLDPFKMNLYQGSFAGKANVNVQESAPKSGVNLAISKVQIGPLLKDAAQKDFLEGTTDAQLNLTMAGDTPEMIKKTLNGQGELKFTDGAVKGFDLAAMARNIKSAFGLEAASTAERPRTDFSELIVPFSITNGVVDTSNASMKSPFVRLEASGKADLVQETLDFRVEPKLVGTIKGQGDKNVRSGVMVPVLVSGTFAAPKFRPDLKAMVQQQIEKGALESQSVKKLEQPAKDLLKNLLKKP